MEITLTSSTSLASLGWEADLAASFAAFENQRLRPGRISTQHKGSYVALTELGPVTAMITGRMRYEASATADLPVVGDWVALDIRPEEKAATVRALLPRRTKFSRKVAGDGSDEQILAANIDTVFLVTSLNEDLNPRRLERYLTMAYENGASPVVLLTKADLCDDIPAALDTVASVAIGTPVHVISAPTGEGLEELKPYISEGQTVALLGSSGVGKSTLVNELAGADLLAVQETREDDDKGRHTTTHREMVLLPGGGIVIDTPGMRELQLWDAFEGLQDSFRDIDALAEGCRFRDCSHIAEPNCAVRAALASGELATERLASFRKLQRELLFLERKVDQRAAQEETRRWKVQHKATRRSKSPKV